MYLIKIGILKEIQIQKICINSLTGDVIYSIIKLTRKTTKRNEGNNGVNKDSYEERLGK